MRRLQHQTDKADAEAIARSVIALRPAPDAGESGPRLRLRALLRRRVQVLQLITIEKGHLESAEPATTAHIRTMLTALQSHLQVIEATIECEHQADARLTRRIGHLSTIPAIGRWSALTLVAELPENLWQRSARSTAAYAGAAPMRHESGQRRGGHATRQGSRHLARALYWPAIVALRCHPRARALAARLRAKGRPMHTIRGAIKHLLVREAAALLRRGETWKAPAPAAGPPQP